jgi:DNA polymerase
MYFMPNAKISDVHGKAMQVRGRLVVAMYHPAAGLHQRSLMSTIEEDFKKIPELIARADKNAISQEQAPVDKDNPRQLNLF